MQTYVALLRGINLGNHNKIAMASLREMFETLGFSEVRTYLQSGNVVFSAGKASTTEIGNRITEAIADRYGLSVPVVVVLQEDIRRAEAENPFMADPSVDETRLHVTFLSDAPDPDLVERLRQESFDPDRFEPGGWYLFLYCPNGYGRTKLSNTFLEKRLKVTATTRNLRTVRALAEM